MAFRLNDNKKDSFILEKQVLLLLFVIWSDVNLIIEYILIIMTLNMTWMLNYFCNWWCKVCAMARAIRIVFRYDFVLALSVNQCLEKMTQSFLLFFSWCLPQYVKYRTNTKLITAHCSLTLSNKRCAPMLQNPVCTTQRFWVST